MATSSITSLALHFSSKEAIVDWVAAKGYTPTSRHTSTSCCAYTSKTTSNWCTSTATICW